MTLGLILVIFQIYYCLGKLYPNHHCECVCNRSAYIFIHVVFVTYTEYCRGKENNAETEREGGVVIRRRVSVAS